MGNRRITPPEGWRPGTLFRYHNERIVVARPHSDELRDWLQQLMGSERSYEPPDAVYHFSRDYLKHLGVKSPILGIVRGEAERCWNEHFFERAGRQIFELTPDLVEKFRRTSVEDVPLSELRSPYTSYYIHFGRAADLEYRSGWFLDGAYVKHVRGDHIVFSLTAVPNDPLDIFNWISVKEPWQFIPLREEMLQLRFGDALNVARQRYQEEFQKLIREGNDQAIADAVHSSKIKGEPNPNSIVNQTVFREDVHQIAVIQQALDIIVNSICYLTAYPEHIAHQWPDYAPTSLVQKASKGPPRRIKRNVSKLRSLGYLKVHFCRDYVRGGPDVQGPGFERGAHWRRGHWRNQAHGVGHKLRKLTWVRPTLVNAKRLSSTSLPGRIYAVDRHAEQEQPNHLTEKRR